MLEVVLELVVEIFMICLFLTGIRFLLIYVVFGKWDIDLENKDGSSWKEAIKKYLKARKERIKKKESKKVE